MHELNLQRVNYSRFIRNLLVAIVIVIVIVFVVVFVYVVVAVGARFKDYLFKLTTNHNTSAAGWREGSGKYILKHTHHRN